MEVHGYVVSQETQDALLAHMKSAGSFTAGDLKAHAITLGVPETAKLHTHHLYVADRVVDRLIQKQRKAGTIKFNKKVWTWV